MLSSSIASTLPRKLRKPSKLKVSRRRVLPEQTFELEVRPDNLATVTFDLEDSSVNIFNQQVVSEFQRLVQELAQRSDIACLVLLSGKPGNFIAGADIDAIAAVTDPLEVEAISRSVHRIFEEWENLPFPTVAAIRGSCVGGGTELALACDYIVSSDRDDIRIGLPEVRLGILPGWGGCTRLPRRVGLTAALDIILAGKIVHPKKALKIGLLDALFPDASFGHLVREFALSKMGKTGPRKRSSNLKTKLLEGNPLGRRIVFNQARKQTLKATRGHYPAPLRALEVVRTGLDRGASAGFDAEARAEGELATSAICKNLVHVFRLMEGAKKDRESSFQPPRLRAVAVLGAGVMGGGIAQLIAAQADVPVRLKDITHEPLARGMAHASGLFSKLVKRRRLSRTEAKRKMNLIRPTLDYRGFGRCDVVIEAIVEILEIKQKVFAELAEHVREDAILASNSSSLSIDLIGRDTPHPERIVGMHFFNPVHRMPLVEIIKGEHTSAETTQAIVALTRRLGKTPVVVNNCPGFLVNRLLAFYSAEALWLLDEGHRMEELDRALPAWGMPIGPIALTDEVGIDVANKVAHILGEAFPDRLTFPSWIDKMVTPERLGAKTQRGLYLYKNGRRSEPDPAIYGLLGIAGDIKSTDGPAIAERTVLPMVNEAARCLDEGVASSPADIDLAMITGIGFPPFRGGLCRWADAQGLTKLVEEMERLSSEVGARHEPSVAVRNFAAAGGFYAA